MALLRGGARFGHPTPYLVSPKSKTVVPLLTALLLPLGVPPCRRHQLQTKSFPSEVWGVLSTTNVGNATEGRGFWITKCYTSVVNSIFKHFQFSAPKSTPLHC